MCLFQNFSQPITRETLGTFNEGKYLKFSNFSIKVYNYIVAFSNVCSINLFIEKLFCNLVSKKKKNRNRDKVPMFEVFANKTEILSDP